MLLLNHYKKRELEIDPSALTTDSYSIVDDPEIDIICELIGGVEEARKITLRAFQNGKPVITANKALICEHGDELFKEAERSGFAMLSRPVLRWYSYY